MTKEMEPIDQERLVRLWRKATLDATPPLLPLHAINFSKLVQEETMQRVATHLDEWSCGDPKCSHENCRHTRKLQLHLRATAAEILR